MTITAPPLVCTATLHSLEESLDGAQALCRNFVGRYIEMWPGRFARLSEALTRGHFEDAMDAALSLRTSSMMVGAVQLGELATDIIRFLESDRTASATRKLPTLHRCGDLTIHQLAVSYVNVA